jgi:hypothetical protein
LLRSRQPGDPDLLAAKQKMTSLKWLEDIQLLVEKAPPLTVEQRDRIAGLLLADHGEDRPQTKGRARSQMIAKTATLSAAGVTTLGGEHIASDLMPAVE